MSHEKAIEKAIKMAGLDGVSHIESRLAVAIKAYLDASGMVMVPRTATPEMVVAARLSHEGEAYLPYSLYSEMISAAPNPFQTPEESREKK